MKPAVFRFDIDTHIGMRSGVPNLLDLADALGVRFTFFVNVGRAMSIRHSLARRASSSNANGSPKLGLTKKLGLRGLFETLVLNPPVGPADPESLKRAQADGHEVGLHGGRNHASWQISARNWTECRIRAEVSWAMARMVAMGLEPPASFSSPGWQGSETLNGVLSELGFRVIADIRGDQASIETNEEGLYSITTNFRGEPGGTGFVSDGLARGETSTTTVTRFASQIISNDMIVVYDHPVVAGRAGLKTVEGMVKAGLDAGFEWVTISELTNQVP